jgi:hypothetical protein
MDCNIFPGAHLVTPRRWYSHHGIYIGNGRVVHYAGLSSLLRRGPIEETSLEDFAQHFGFRVQPYAEAAFSPEEIVLRAMARMGENLYDMLSNNCEHFCVWCVCGQARSAQVERFRRYPARVVALVASALNRLAGALFGNDALAPGTPGNESAQAGT